MKNKSKLWYLVKYNLSRKLKSRWFIVTNIILLIIIAAVINIDTIINYFGGNFDEKTIIYVESTDEVYEELSNSFNQNNELILSNLNVEIKNNDENIDALKEEMTKSEVNNIIVEVNSDTYDVNITSYEYIDTTLYQSLVNSLNAMKQTQLLKTSSIDKEELAHIYTPCEIDREYLSEDLDEKNEFMAFIAPFLIPVLIVPVFFLIIMSVNFVGADINEEKTSRSMEIIISSISPKTHFFSKIISTNLFVLIQGLLFVIFIVVGLLLRINITDMSLVNSFGIDPNQIKEAIIDTGILSNILYSLPFVFIMMILTSLAYSMLAGILASMTTSMEDYQQIQTPYMIIMMFAYYAAILSTTYDSSVFIRIVSYIPFVSGLLSPVLLINGQIGFIDVIISTLLLVGTIFLLIRYGLRIYKVGILNYSSSKLWNKVFKAAKSK